MDNIYSNKDLPEHLEGADEQRGRAVRLRALNTISDKKERNRTSSEYLNVSFLLHGYVFTIYQLMVKIFKRIIITLN